MGDIKKTLNERQKTHGDFSVNCVVSQEIQRVIDKHCVTELSDVQKEALQMFCHKIGRICAGNPNEPDHWRDIAGYL